MEMDTEYKELLERLQNILSKVEFEGYAFRTRVAHGGVVVYGEYWEEDIYTSVDQQQQTRKWLISPFMSDSEIVQTIFKLCATSMEHRLREHFKYKNARVFGPHFDVEDLVKLCKDRENAGGRKQDKPNP